MPQSKGIAAPIIIIPTVVLLILGSLAAWQLTHKKQSPSPSPEIESTRATYTNKPVRIKQQSKELSNFYFRVKQPTDWSVKQNNLDDGISIELLAPKQIAYPRISIEVYRNASFKEKITPYERLRFTKTLIRTDKLTFTQFRGVMPFLFEKGKEITTPLQVVSSVIDVKDEVYVIILEYKGEQKDDQLEQVLQEVLQSFTPI